jgi:O-antigen/teichoic acid export membrane protein
MNIGRKDVIWTYVSTFLQIGTGLILLPLILRVFPQEIVALWTIFTTMMALTNLLDFGFNPTFARNVSYVISGIKRLKVKGYNIVESHNSDIDYGLFKGLIDVMKWFYARMALLLLVILLTAGTYYIHTILKTYSGSHAEVYIAWTILVSINSYSLYTMYYDSLMQGKGLIRRSKQIKIIGQGIYLIVATILILLQLNLIAVVSAQALSIVMIRILSRRTIYTAEFKQMLQGVTAQARKKILSTIYPNAVKVGLTSLGGFLVTRSSIVIGSLYLSLDEIASYGITIQIITIISSIASVYFATYQPKIVQCRVQNDSEAIKRLYMKGCVFQFNTFVFVGIALFFLGEWAMSIIESETPLLSKSFIAVALFIHLLETNHANAGSILSTKNEVPYFKAALVSGVFTVTLSYIFLNCTYWGVWGLMLAPGIVQLGYQNWKWPMQVATELQIKKKDVAKALKVFRQ